jgi:hypothetical protein
MSRSDPDAARAAPHASLGGYDFIPPECNGGRAAYARGLDVIPLIPTGGESHEGTPDAAPPERRDLRDAARESGAARPGSLADAAELPDD